jgi:hypothetical protein
MDGDEGGLHCEGSGVCISKKMLSPSGDAVRDPDGRPDLCIVGGPEEREQWKVGRRTEEV